MNNIKNTLWYSVLIVILLVGIYSAYMQASQGHIITGISDQVPWGVYIAAFTFFIGISTGSTLIGFIIYVFKRDDLKSLELRAVTLGLVTLVGALLLLISDVGNPVRLLKVPLFLRNTSSVFFYTSLSYYAFGSILLVQLIYIIKLRRNPENEKYKNILRWFSIIAFPVAMGIVLVPDGALFSFVKAREFWNRPLLLPHFANAGLVSAISVLIFFAFISEKIENRKLINDESKSLIAYLLTFLVAGVLFLDLFDILVLNYSEKPEGIAAWNLLTGEHLFLFILNIFGLLVAFLMLLSKKGRSFPNITLPAVIIVFAISAYRYNLIIVGQEIPLFNGEQIMYYTPSFTEISICSGITALALLLYRFILKGIENNTFSLSKA